MSRKVSLDIHPAQALTCGDGIGGFCQFARVSHYGTVWSCAIFGRLEEKAGWLARHDGCLEAEAAP